MNLVDCKCPNCNASIKVNPGKDAAICDFCGEAFVVERAINNYGTINNGDVITNHNYAKDTIATPFKKKAEAELLKQQIKLKEKEHEIEQSRIAEEEERNKPYWYKVLEGIGFGIAFFALLAFSALMMWIAATH